SYSISNKAKNQIKNNITRKDSAPYLQPLRLGNTKLFHINGKKYRKTKLSGGVDYPDNPGHQYFGLFFYYCQSFDQFLHFGIYISFAKVQFILVKYQSEECSYQHP